MASFDIRTSLNQIVVAAADGFAVVVTSEERVIKVTDGAEKLIGVDHEHVTLQPGELDRAKDFGADVFAVCQAVWTPERIAAYEARNPKPVEEPVAAPADAPVVEKEPVGP